jgi:hypothetical protein
MFGLAPNDLADAQTNARALAIVTGVLAAATVVSAGVSVYLHLSRSPDAPPRENARVDVFIAPAGLAVRGAF